MYKWWGEERGECTGVHNGGGRGSGGSVYVWEGGIYRMGKGEGEGDPTFCDLALSARNLAVMSTAKLCEVILPHQAG
jgi:hypothetical protein